MRGGEAPRSKAATILLPLSHSPPHLPWLEELAKEEVGIFDKFREIGRATPWRTLHRYARNTVNYQVEFHSAGGPAKYAGVPRIHLPATRPYGLDLIRKSHRYLNQPVAAGEFQQAE